MDYIFGTNDWGHGKLREADKLSEEQYQGLTAMLKQKII